MSKNNKKSVKKVSSVKRSFDIKSLLANDIASIVCFILSFLLLAWISYVGFALGKDGSLLQLGTNGIFLYALPLVLVFIFSCTFFTVYLIKFLNMKKNKITNSTLKWYIVMFGLLCALFAFSILQFILVINYFVVTFIYADSAGEYGNLLLDKTPIISFIISVISAIILIPCIVFNSMNLNTQRILRIKKAPSKSKAKK